VVHIFFHTPYNKRTYGNRSQILASFLGRDIARNFAYCCRSIASPPGLQNTVHAVRGNNEVDLHESLAGYLCAKVLRNWLSL